MEALRPASRCLHKRTTAGGPITNVISHPSAVRCVKGLVPTSHDMPPLLKIPTTNTSVSITEKEVHAANTENNSHNERFFTAGQFFAILELCTNLSATSLQMSGFGKFPYRQGRRWQFTHIPFSMHFNMRA
jgi:hypothetical protein